MVLPNVLYAIFPNLLSQLIMNIFNLISQFIWAAIWIDKLLEFFWMEEAIFNNFGHDFEITEKWKSFIRGAKPFTWPTRFGWISLKSQ